MIIVDKVLEQRRREGRPIRLGLVGAGFMARRPEAPRLLTRHDSEH